MIKRLTKCNRKESSSWIVKETIAHVRSIQTHCTRVTSRLCGRVYHYHYSINNIYYIYHNRWEQYSIKGVLIQHRRWIFGETASTCHPDPYVSPRPSFPFVSYRQISFFINKNSTSSDSEVTTGSEMLLSLFRPIVSVISKRSQSFARHRGTWTPPIPRRSRDDPSKTVIRDCHRARPCSVCHGTVSCDPCEAISHREGRETAFHCILDPLSRARPSSSEEENAETLVGVTRRRLSARPQKLQSRASLAFSLSVLSTSAPPLSLRYLQWRRKKKKETDASLVLLPCVDVRFQSRRAFRDLIAVRSQPANPVQSIGSIRRSRRERAESTDSMFTDFRTRRFAFSFLFAYLWTLVSSNRNSWYVRKGISLL